MERTSGPWSVLKNASVYASFQDILGAEKARTVVVKDNIRPFAGARVLDVGCGPCDLFVHLAGVRYVGVDRSADYISAARARFGDRGEFICADVTDLPVSKEAQFDIAIAFGLLHHLTDDEVSGLVEEVARRLAPGGRLITLDPVFEDKQNLVARLLVSMDRGQHVRKADDYAALLGRSFGRVERRLHRHLIRVPYSHLVLEASAA